MRSPGLENILWRLAPAHQNLRRSPCLLKLTSEQMPRSWCSAAYETQSTNLLYHPPGHEIQTPLHDPGWSTTFLAAIQRASTHLRRPFHATAMGLVLRCRYEITVSCSRSLLLCYFKKRATNQAIRADHISHLPGPGQLRVMVRPVPFVSHAYCSVSISRHDQTTHCSKLSVHWTEC